MDNIYVGTREGMGVGGKGICIGLYTNGKVTSNHVMHVHKCEE